MRKSNRRKKTKIDNKILKYNRGIRAEFVMVIDEVGEILGEMDTRKALALALEKGTDLVEVSPKAIPPVVKIMDYGEYKYKREKQEQKNKASQKKIEIKGIRLSFKISKHDLEFRKEKSKIFLENGHKVKIDLILRGRERQHQNLAFDIVNNFIAELGNEIKKEQPVQRQGGVISAIITK
ncbi:translation initiation factor IF-3 [Patescibacteria group bacterium]